MKTTKTVRMAFNAEELEMLNAALNSYACKMMGSSTTWGNVDAIIENRRDIYHRHADVVNHLWCRVYECEQRLNK